MPLFEATESIIKFFRLGEFTWNVPFLNTFQDYIVNFTAIKMPIFRHSSIGGKRAVKRNLLFCQAIRMQ
jgi:hypothetical protein